MRDLGEMEGDAVEKEVGVSGSICRLLPSPAAYVNEGLATGYGEGLDLAGIHVAASDHLLRLRQLRGSLSS